MRTRPRYVWSAALVSVSAALLSAAPRQGVTKPLHVDSNLVLIGTTVTDQSGRFVPYLREKDFRLFDEGVEQRIRSVSVEDAPVSFGIVFDSSGSMAATLGVAKQALRGFLETANPDDEFFLVTVRSRPELTTGFLSDANDLLAKMSLETAHGYTALIDSVYLAASRLKQARNRRRALLVISDGKDNCSRYKQRDLKSLLRETDASVYSIGIRSSPVSFSPEGGWPSELDLLAGIAEETGGRYFEASDARELRGIFDRLDIRLQYVVSYRPEAVSADGRYHKVKLKLAGRAHSEHLMAFWKPGYYSVQQKGDITGW